MFLVSSNPIKNLLMLRYIDRVKRQDFEWVHSDLLALLAGLKPGLRVLVDCTQLEHMSHDCISPIGDLMELIDQRGAELIVRVIPDPYKDIGLNILTAFHYKKRPNIAT